MKLFFLMSSLKCSLISFTGGPVVSTAISQSKGPGLDLDVTICILSACFSSWLTASGQTYLETLQSLYMCLACLQWYTGMSLQCLTFESFLFHLAMSRSWNLKSVINR